VTAVSYSELEIGLSLDQAGEYRVELRFDTPDDDAERTPVRGPAPLDPEGLLELQLDPDGYGRALEQSLFEDPEVSRRYAEFKAVVESNEQDLRVKLFIDRSAPELHRLRWELLTDPRTGLPLATSERILFSRFGASDDWRPVRLRPKSALRALVAVSNPTNLRDQDLAPVDVDREVARASKHLKGIEIEVAGKDAPLTLDRLIERLRGGVDILYLVCHGALVGKSGSRLWLQKETGEIAPTGGAELARQLREMKEGPPRLVVLASCESAGSEAVSTQEEVIAGQLVPLAPALAEAGVHAVIAMQGKVSIETITTAMPVFFEELLKDGQIDRAMARARSSVRERPDSWMPALFLRLKGGKLWYEPGFGEDDFKWAGLVDAVQSGGSVKAGVLSGGFTPIVGPGLGEPVYGSLRDAARELADHAGFPLARYQRDELSQVAQFMRNEPGLGEESQRVRVNRQVKQQILGRPLTLKEATEIDLSEIMTRVGEERRKEPTDPYRLLAKLPAKVFVTATADNLLVEALSAEGKSPDVFVFEWRRLTGAEERYDKVPTESEPLVFHLFGRSEDDFIALTEDDYFDYLIAWTQYKERIPGVVADRLAYSSLLFLGFQPTDLSFRTLLRLIKSQGGEDGLKRFVHVAVQISPDEDNLINARKARAYLQDYFKSAASDKFAIFWGSAGEFLQELDRRVSAS
jgi:CHAT domain/SIR2-like domain